MTTARGAFRRFKDTLRRWPEQLDAWYAFSEERQLGRARAWLADQGYTAVRQLPWTAGRRRQIAVGRDARPQLSGRGVTVVYDSIGRSTFDASLVPRSAGRTAATGTVILEVG